MLRRILSGTAVVALALTVAGCGSDSDSSSSTTTSAQTAVCKDKAALEDSVKSLTNLDLASAGEGTIDLAGANLASVDLTINAGSARIDLAGAERLGDLDATVNAGATTIELPAGGRAVNLSMNAGNLTVCVPAGAPMRVTWGGALGSNNLPAAGLVKVDDDTWTSSGFSEATPHLEVRGRANAGSFTLDTDGTCDA